MELVLDGKDRLRVTGASKDLVTGASGEMSKRQQGDARLWEL